LAPGELPGSRRECGCKVVEGKVACVEGNDFPDADDLIDRAMAIRAGKDRPKFRDEAIVNLPLHTHADSFVEGRRRSYECVKAGWPSSRAVPQTVEWTIGHPTQREFEGPDDPSGVSRVDSVRRLRVKLPQALHGPFQVEGDDLLGLGTPRGVHDCRKSELGNRRPHVKAGSTGHDGRTSAGDHVVDHAVRAGAELTRGRSLTEVEISNEVVRHFVELIWPGAVGGDLEATVALKRIANDDLPTEGPSNVVRDGAFSDGRWAQDPKDLRR
jgi:hypothetical protein